MKLIQYRNAFYSCPNCSKVVFSWLEDDQSSSFYGMEAFYKKECPFCDTKVSLSWNHFILLSLMTIGFMAGMIAIVYLIATGLPEIVRLFFGLLLFPLGALLFFMTDLVDIVAGCMGFKFYKSAEDGQTET